MQTKYTYQTLSADKMFIRKKVCVCRGGQKDTYELEKKVYSLFFKF